LFPFVRAMIINESVHFKDAFLMYITDLKLIDTFFFKQLTNCRL